MPKKLVTAPTVEPVSLSEAKAFLRIESSNFASDLALVPLLAPVTLRAGTQQSEAVEVLGYRSVVGLALGVVDAGTTLEAIIQESSDGQAFVDAEGGAFPLVTEGNQVLELEYTGVAQYIRLVLVVVGDGSVTCSAQVAKDSSTNPDDPRVRALITAARQRVEEYTGKALITQAWDYHLDAFPSATRQEASKGLGFIELPLYPIQSVEGVFYRLQGGDEATLDPTIYLVDNVSEPARVAKRMGAVWPTGLEVINAVRVRFTAGYGPSGASVPGPIKQAILHWVAHLYERPEDEEMPKLVEALLWPYRLPRF